MTNDRHACPDCGAKHRKLAPKKTQPRTHLETTDLAGRRCHHCRQPVLAGRVTGVDYQLDPRPINELGAITYTAIGRTIIIRAGHRGHLADHWKTWPPADGEHWHTIHDCAKPVPHELGDAGIDKTRRANHTPPVDPPY